MEEQIRIPDKRLSKNVVKVMLINEVISALIGLGIVSALFFLHDYFAWKDWIKIGFIIGTALWGISQIKSFIRPFFLYKNWRYDVDESFLQMKSGALNEVHELIPMTKIQAVSTTQGPILRRYQLYRLTVETVSSSHTIPGLPENIAIELRNQIAVFAKIKEVEE